MNSHYLHKPVVAHVLNTVVVAAFALWSHSLVAQESVSASSVPRPQPILTTPVQTSGFTIEKFGASAPIQAPTISKPAPIRNEGVAVESIAVPNFHIQPITPSASFNFNRGGATRSPTAFTKNSFEYNRYNRFGGNSKIDNNPAQNPRQIRAQQGERIEKVQSIVPSLDGYDIVQGYTFNPPDFSRDSDWVWLPITSR